MRLAAGKGRGVVDLQVCRYLPMFGETFSVLDNHLGGGL